MTDLESACRELVHDLRQKAEANRTKAKRLNAPKSSAFGRGAAAAQESIADDLEEILDENTPSLVDVLAEATGRPRERFEADDKPIPELDELDSEVKELVDTMEDAT